jgi:translation initiation factor IF-2
VEGDVTLASASNAIIIGFHVRPTPKAQMLAEQEKVDIRKYNIIYTRRGYPGRHEGSSLPN